MPTRFDTGTDWFNEFRRFVVFDTNHLDETQLAWMTSMANRDVRTGVLTKKAYGEIQKVLENNRGSNLKK